MADIGPARFNKNQAGGTRINGAWAVICAMLLLSCASAHGVDRMDDLNEAKKRLVNTRWVQSPDSASQMSFRPAGDVQRKEPGRRGAARRMQMEFRPDGTCTVVGMGPADRPQSKSCTWALEMQDELILSIELSPDEKTRLIIADIKPDHLRIKKK
jgi:hypothetical protein